MLRIGTGARCADMPQVGLGVWKAARGVTEDVVYAALRAGYRLIDGACDYGNEEAVGAGVKRAVQEGLVKREDLFITSKLWNTFHRREHVGPACRRTLQDLGLDYLDLYLIHFPISLKFVPFEKRYPPEWIHDPDGENKMVVDPVPYRETWEAMEALVDEGLVKNIGVSNVSCALLMDVLSYARIPPAVNQVEMHLWLQQPALREFCGTVGVKLTAYSPLGSLSYVELGGAKPEDDSVLTNVLIGELAEKYQRTRAQVALKFLLQQGVAIIPKSTKPERLAENLASAEKWELQAEDVARLEKLDANRRFNDPAGYTKFMGMPAGYPIFA